MYTLLKCPLGKKAMKPWLIANSIFVIAQYPIGALQDINTVSTGNNPELIVFRPSMLIDLLVETMTDVLLVDKSLGDIQGIPPSTDSHQM